MLLVEDSSVYRAMITRYLREWSYDVTVVKDGLEAWKLLQQPDAPKLLVADWVLPGMDGVELCRNLRKKIANDSYIYTILLTGKCDREDLLEAMAAGADDYLTKPFDELELQARLQVGKRILDLQQELVTAREGMRHAATHDALTGLMNRKETLAFLSRELVRAKRERASCGVIMADIDHFKRINDSQGHLFGDEVLKEVSHRLGLSLRVYDGVGRYGGEEFIMVLPGCDLKATLHRADEIRKFVCAQPIVKSEIQTTVTMSLGVAVADGTRENRVEALLQQADEGLYAAKAKGRNRVEYLSSSVVLGAVP